MSLSFPSPEFDQVVAAICHGTATEAEMEALNRVLRDQPAAQDEYLLRVEIHARLASDPDLFVPALPLSDSAPLEAGPRTVTALPSVAHPSRPVYRGLGAGRILALAACLCLVAVGAWSLRLHLAASRTGPTSTAVAMLTRVVDARWAPTTPSVRVGSALTPGWLHLESGMAQVVSYTGARLVLEGPAKLRLISPGEVICAAGKLVVEVPPPARGFRVRTEHAIALDRGSAFGVEATPRRTDIHVFGGRVDVQTQGTEALSLGEGQAVACERTAPPRRLPMNPAIFVSMCEFQQRSQASEALRFDQWRLTNARLNLDPSLVVHFDFESLRDGDWTVVNAVESQRPAPDGTIVGCQRVPGRWREKQALEFQGVNDRLRFEVPGEFSQVTLSTWVCLQGLDRQFNSIFMCDGFEPGTLHWLIRNDGVLGLTVFGQGEGNFQILASPSVITPADLGLWLHLAVVLDGNSRSLTQYLNGEPVSRHRVKVEPPYRIGPTELGNWNSPSGPDPAPALIRNLSGAIDEFELFSRALSETEIRELYRSGSTEP